MALAVVFSVVFVEATAYLAFGGEILDALSAVWTKVSVRIVMDAFSVYPNRGAACALGWRRL